MNLPTSRKALLSGAAILLLLLFVIGYISVPLAEVAIVQRGTAIAAVYGSVRIEPTLVLPVRAQNAGLIRLADPLAAGRGSLGRSLEKGELLATIADEATARQLKQARTDLKAATDRAALPLPSEELLRASEDNLQRIEKLASLSNVPAVEYEKAKSETSRLKNAVETERIERERNLAALEEATTKLESQMRNTDIRSPIEGILTEIKTLDGELVGEGNQLFTVASRRTYVRGEVNEEDVGAVKIGMRAILQVYAFRERQFKAKVIAILPSADAETQRYTIALSVDDPPENLLAGMSGEMNIITGSHDNVLLVPTRAILADKALIVKRGIVQSRTLAVGYRTLDVSEITSGVEEGDHVVVSDQDQIRPGKFVKQRVVSATGRVK